MSVWYVVAAVILVGVAGLVIVYRRDKRLALERFRAMGTVAQTSAGPVEYMVLGDGAPILLMHGGAGGACEQAELLTKILAPHQFQVICPSRPGYRRTPLSTGASFESQADAAAALLDRLGVKRVTVLGISAGGPTAIRFALRHPGRCRGLILLSAHGPGTVPYMPSRFLIDLLKMLTVTDLITWLYLKIPMGLLLLAEGSPARLVTPEVVRLAHDTAWLGFPASDLNVGTFNDTEQILASGDWPLEQITHPTLILHGQKDQIVKIDVAKYHAAHIPNSNLTIYPDGTHFTFATYRKDVAEAVAHFLA